MCAHDCRCSQKPEVWDPPGAGVTGDGEPLVLGA